MKRTVSIDDSLLVKAKQLNDKSNEAIAEEALKLFIAIESQKKLRELKGKIKFYDKV